MHKGGNISDMGTPPLGARLFRELVGRCIVIPSKRMFVLKNPTKGPLKKGIFQKIKKNNRSYRGGKIYVLWTVTTILLEAALK